MFELVIQTDVSGRVEVEPSSSAWPRSPSKTASANASNGSAKNSESEDSNATPGKILYELNGKFIRLLVPKSSSKLLSNMEFKSLKRVGELLN